MVRSGRLRLGIVALGLALWLGACGGQQVEAPVVSCVESAPGSGVLAQDLIGSWSFINNAAWSTHTFRNDGTVLIHLGTDEPGKDPIQRRATWAIVDGSQVRIEGDDLAETYGFELEADGTWTVDSFVKWVRCG